VTILFESAPPTLAEGSVAGKARDSGRENGQAGTNNALFLPNRFG